MASIKDSGRRVTAPVDVTDPDLYADGDPLPVWERMRATAPVHWNDHPAHGDGSGG